MTGKDKCSILKHIRCKIARENGIEYHPRECTFKGECRGTCPKCEAELKYITSELQKIKNAGKQIAVAGVAAAIITTTAGGCARKPESAEKPIVIDNTWEKKSPSAGSEGEKADVKPEAKPEATPESDGLQDAPQNNAPTDVQNGQDSTEDITYDTPDDEIDPSLEQEYAEDEYTVDEGYIIQEAITGDVAYIETEGDVELTGTTDHKYDENYTPESQTQSNEIFYNGVKFEPTEGLPAFNEVLASGWTAEDLTTCTKGFTRDEVRGTWAKYFVLRDEENKRDEYECDGIVMHVYFDDGYEVIRVENGVR